MMTGGVMVLGIDERMAGIGLLFQCNLVRGVCSSPALGGLIVNLIFQQDTPPTPPCRTQLLTIHLKRDGQTYRLPPLSQLRVNLSSEPQSFLACGVTSLRYLLRARLLSSVADTR